MKCAVGHCGHCQLGPEFVCRDGPVFTLRAHPRRVPDPGALMAGASRSSRSGSSPPATAASSACSTARTSCSPLAGRDRDRLLPRGAARDRRGPVRPVARRGLDHDAARRRAHPARCGSRRGALVTIGACATAGGIQALRNFADVDEFVVGRLRDARVHLDARRPRRRSARTCTVDFELRGCPINKRQLLEVISAFLNERKPADPRAQRLHRVQAARHRLRDGRARHALPGPGHARRLRRDLPGLQPRLLRLLRPDGDARTRASLSEWWKRLGVTDEPARARLPQLQRRGRSRSASESEAHERG